MSIIWLADATDQTRVVFRIGRDGDRLLARWAGLGTLITNRDGSDATFEEEPGADARLVAKLRTGTMRALLRHVRGELTLHASGVAARGRAIAFVGDSGAGKSTLAFSLASGRYDFALLSDDCLCIDGTTALPSETCAWLDAAARTALDLGSCNGKAPAVAPRVAGEPVPLHAIVHLAYGDAPGVRQLRGAAAAAVLARAVIRFVLDEPSVHRADLERMAELAQRVSVLELVRPRGFEHFVEVTRMIDAINHE